MKSQSSEVRRRRGGNETLRDLLFVKGWSIYSRHWRSEWCHHGCINSHLLMAEKNSTPRISLAAQWIEKKKTMREKMCVGTMHSARLWPSHVLRTGWTHKDTHIYAIMSQLLHVLSEGFSAWGQKGERLWLGHALFIVCSGRNITR